MSSFYYLKSLRPVKLKLGEYYTLKRGFGNNIKSRAVKFIKPTKKGYNFLDLKTSRCIFRQHLYPSKLNGHTNNNETWFWIHVDLTIE